MLNIKKAKNEYNFKIKKSLGQNFLQDEEVLDNIVEKSNIDNKTLVIEIGPGLGALTERLIKKSKYVISIEYDKSLENILHNNINAENWTLIIDDFLQTDLNNVLTIFQNELKCTDEELKKYKIKIVANLPYYITQAIIMKILKSNINISEMTIMLQKEVADRIFANEKTKEYGLLTIFINYYANKERLFEVNRKSFNPVPNVDSTVIKLKLKNEQKDIIEEKQLEKILHAAFQTRRKTLVNCLTNNNILPKEKILDTLQKLNLNEMCRAEELTLEQYLQFIDLIKT